MKTLVFLLFLALSIPAVAQTLLKTVEVSDTIIHAYVDRPGDLYIITKAGQIQKFDSNGKLLVLFKSHKHPTLFEPRDGSRLFAYYRSSQHYEYLTPSFDVTKAYRIDSSFVIQPWLICTSGDHKLWVLDEADHSLKRVNPQESEVEVEVVIDSTLIKDATIFESMREYQGFVFIHDKSSGIHIFNSMGKHLRTIKVHGIDSFNFLGEEMYYSHRDKLTFFDLFSAETRDEIKAPGNGQVLLTDQRLFHIHPRKVEVYEYIPSR
jgi:hypothetical protein